MAVTIDYSGFRRKQKLIEAKMKQAGEATIANLCKAGKFYAKSIAPLYSGTLIGSISYKTSQGQTGEVYIKDIPEPHRTSNSIAKTTVALSRWMHKSNGMLGGNKHIISGSPRFMYRTKDYMNTIKKGVAKGHFDKIKIN
jgi:hypothetical protein